jgi:predicted esterase
VAGFRCFKNGLGEFMISHYLKRAISNRVGLGLAIIVILFIVGCRLLVIACSHTPSHWRAIAGEIGSVAQFREDYYPVYPNQDGTRIGFLQETEKGVGIFFCDTDSGKTKLLCEQKEDGYSWQRFGMLGWSPDDKLFAYAVPLDHRLNPGQREEQIVLCDSLSGEAAAKIPEDPDLTEIAWLSPQEFACLTYDQHVTVWKKKKRSGEWAQSLAYTNIASGRVETIQNSFTATSESSVAWQKGDEIWTLDFSTSTLKKIWESDVTYQLEGFTYSRETKGYHLICRDDIGWFFIDLDPQGSALDVTRAENRGEYAYSRDEAGTNVFYIKTKTDVQPTRVFWQGAVEDNIGPIEDYKSSGKYLYGNYLFFTGDLPGQPVGLWRYNIQDGMSRCLVSGLKRPLVHARIVNPQGGAVTNTLGKQMSYHVWEPVNVQAGKKYPLIITQAPYGWPQYQQVAAQEGYYFAIVDRPYWSDKTIYHWSADVMALYSMMAKNPNVDTNRVFLFGFSWSADFLSQLMSEEPDLWKGAILINPAALPDLSSLLHNPRLFIVAGKDQAGEIDRLTKYQDTAAKLGVPVKLVLQKGSGHIPRSVATERERTVQFARFLVEN